jgi:Predicted pyridoxal phosphate-dependent enzyme apparently involved in regulation of cell wall biogenesis
MTNLQAALGCAQLERIEELTAAKRRIVQQYRQEFAEVTALTMNPRETWAEPVVSMACAVVRDWSAAKRDEVIAVLREAEIDTRPFFVPLGKLPPYEAARQVGVDEEYAARAVVLGGAGMTLPSGATLHRDDVALVAAHLKQAICD